MKLNKLVDFDYLKATNKRLSLISFFISIKFLYYDNILKCVFVMRAVRKCIILKQVVHTDYAELHGVLIFYYVNIIILRHAYI